MDPARRGSFLQGYAKFFLVKIELMLIFNYYLIKLIYLFYGITRVCSYPR